MLSIRVLSIYIKIFPFILFIVSVVNDAIFAIRVMNLWCFPRINFGLSVMHVMRVVHVIRILELCVLCMLYASYRYARYARYAWCKCYESSPFPLYSALSLPCVCMSWTVQHAQHV